MLTINTANAAFASCTVEADELANHLGETVCIRGMIYKIRMMSGFAFVLLRTLDEIVQCVWSERESSMPITMLSANMSVIIEGDIVRDDRSRAGYELRIRNCAVLSRPARETPVVINGKEMTVSLETLLDYRPITLRHDGTRCIFKIQDGIVRGFRSFLTATRFTEIHTPKIVSSGAEGGANIFKLDYFGREAYLAQSPQFYKQIMVGVFERVFEIAPVFRAEKHHTTRHINEYTSVDLEMGFINSFRDLMLLETQMIRATLDFLTQNNRAELDRLGVQIPVVQEIPTVRFDEAKRLIATAYRRESADDMDFEPEEERLLCDLIKKETQSEFVFVTHYKAAKRPFYTMNTPGETEVTESFDLLFRGVEVTTGGQRIHDYQAQLEKMRALAMNSDCFNSYLMAHQYGLPPHGGLGLGLERFTARLIGLPNVRQATLFPRDAERLDP